MALKEIIRQWLEANVYDGLFNIEFDCACELSDLLPCGNPALECRPGYKVECDCEENHNFHIEANKQTEGG